MLSPGILIAIDVTILYMVMAPLVLFAIYAAFDCLAFLKEGQLKQLGTDPHKNTILWSDEDSSL